MNLMNSKYDRVGIGVWVSAAGPARRRLLPPLTGTIGADWTDAGSARATMIGA